MLFGEKRLVWDDKSPEGGSSDAGKEAVDTSKKESADTGSVDVADKSAKKESMQEREKLAQEVEEGGVDADGDKGTDTDTNPETDTDTDDGEKGPFDRLNEYFEGDEFKKDKEDGKWAKIIGKTLLLFFGAQKAMEASMSTEEVDAEKKALVTAYTALIAEMVKADKLPTGIVVSDADVGVLAGEYEISTADDLKKYLEGKAKMEIGGAQISLSDYLDKVKKRENPAVAATVTATTTASGAVVLSEAASTSPFAVCPTKEVSLVGTKSHRFELTSGEKITLEHQYVVIGGKRFAAKAKSGDQEAPITFESVKPIASGGFEFEIKPVLEGWRALGALAGMGGPRSVNLNQEKSVALVKALYKGATQGSFTHQVADPNTGNNVEFTFTAA
ncbi:hypothetical protein A2244_01660 [Candidatus Peregrinibacteria bacterium RIFOXYA2_FULL_41_18]|nr:MAG: hypothetical protein A2244_01660 [Candidatus Peregrinibacteria bacterium RIFOXYA2_FULL_41_18]OGJ53172.1 MAG: hypothetical protein A2448_04575 [Candidatus Peregrinibacteria bacterium RIFOXYC2_FULL_41_22]